MSQLKKQNLSNPNYSYDFIKNRRFKWTLTIACSLFSVLILIIFQPFGVNNYQHEFSITVEWVILVSGFGIVGLIVLGTSEFLVQPLVLKRITTVSAIAWFFWDFLIVGSGNFLYYNILSGYRDMQVSSLVIFIINTSLVIVTPFVGTLFYFRYLNLKKEYVEILTLSSEKSELNDIILISGDYKKDKIALSPSKLLFIESQDNYVALNYLEENELKKNLIRSTLSNMENTLEHPFLMRCNRSFIVNLLKVESIKKENGKLKLKMLHYSEEIIVSKKHMPDVNHFLEANFSKKD